MITTLPKYVSDTLKTLNNGGFEAWCVGGAVRDLIMGKTPFDYDITTSALPTDIIALFPKTVPTGIKHGTVTVVTDFGNIEVTSYRSENGYSDHRSPDGVEFITDIKEDLKRRDFTVNAICFNPEYGIFDPENGISDIEKKVLRAIGEPERRFEEDALRILRLFRFSAQLGFAVQEKTLVSALKKAHLLKSISVERIFSETVKIFLSDDPSKADPLFLSGSLDFLGIPADEIPKNIGKLPEDFSLRFLQFAKDSEFDAVYVLKKLKSDNFTIKRVEAFKRLLSMPIPDGKAKIKQMLQCASEGEVRSVLTLCEIGGRDMSVAKAALSEVLRLNEPYTVSSLAVNGNDLKEAGFSGENIGVALNKALNRVIEYPKDNNKETLLKFLTSNR